MHYDYYCPNTECKNNKEVIEIQKKMAESSRAEFCPICNTELKRTIESLVCGISVDKTNSFFRKCN